MSRATSAASLVLLSALTSYASSAHANIVNGSFESGQAYVGAPYNLVSGAPAPWFATSYTPDLYDNSGVDGWGMGGIPVYDNMFQGMLAYHGRRFIGFAATTEFGRISESFAQTTAPLTPGQTYTLSARIAADDSGRGSPGIGGPYVGRGQVGVLLNGIPIGTLTQNTVSFTWERRSFSFVAPVASTYTFKFVAQLDPSIVGGGSSYIGVDRCIVPSPGVLAIFGLVGMVRSRRR